MIQFGECKLYIIVGVGKIRKNKTNKDNTPLETAETIGDKDGVLQWQDSSYSVKCFQMVSIEL